MRINQSAQNTGNAIYISETDDDGGSVQSFMETMDSVTSAVKAHIRISKKFETS